MISQEQKERLSFIRNDLQILAKGIDAIIDGTSTQSEIIQKLQSNQQQFHNATKNGTKSLLQVLKIMDDKTINKILQISMSNYERLLCRIIGINPEGDFPFILMMSPDCEDILNHIFETQLTQREADVLRFRYGLDNGEWHSLDECGQEFRRTRERIRQIESKALRKIRRPSNMKQLLPDYQLYCNTIQDIEALQPMMNRVHQQLSHAQELYSTMLRQKDIAETIQPTIKELSKYLDTADVQFASAFCPETQDALKSHNIRTMDALKKIKPSVFVDIYDNCPAFHHEIDKLTETDPINTDHLKVLNTPLEELSLQVRTYNALKHCCTYKVLAHILCKNKKQLMEIRNFGTTCINDLTEVLAQFGFTLE